MGDLFGFRTGGESMGDRFRLVVEDNERAFRTVEGFEGRLDDGHLGEGVDGELHSGGVGL